MSFNQSILPSDGKNTWEDSILVVQANIVLYFAKQWDETLSSSKNIDINSGLKSIWINIPFGGIILFTVIGYIQ